MLVPQEPTLPWSALLPGLGALKAPPRPPGARVHPCFFARNAVFHGIRALGLRAGETVLVPSYHCATLVEPIVRTGAEVAFYDVRDDCTTNFPDLERRIGAGARAVVAIHYFGFPQPMAAFRELCRRRRLALIEDCAHVLAGETDGAAIGSLGDISVFSWRKFLPLYGGGFLVVNDPAIRESIPAGRIRPLLTAKVVKNVLSRTVGGSSSRVPAALARLAELPARLVRRRLSQGGRPDQVLALDEGSLEFDPSLVDLPMSRVSRYVLRGFSIPEVVEARRRNYNALAERVRGLDGISPLHPEAPPGVGPWVFPLRVRDRRRFHHALRARGVPAVTWAGVMHPRLSVEEYPDARWLYDQLVLLPIHQSLGAREIEIIGAAIEDALLRPAGDEAGDPPVAPGRSGGAA